MTIPAPTQESASADQETFDAEHASFEDVFGHLQCGKEGLTAEEAGRRFERYGPNALEEKKESPLLKFLSYFWGPIPWMIEVAAILSLVVEHLDDFVIIMVLLIFNAVIGFWEEFKAANALEALKKGLALKARARRDGEWSDVDAARLVPGDLIRLRLGDVIPADCKLMEGDYVSIDQAALTGESLPVNKKVGEIGFSGSIVKQGEMVALVTATGGDTFFGRTAKLVASAGAVSHFQKAVLKIGDFLIFVAVALSILLVGFELYRDIVVKDAWNYRDIINIVQFVLILVIASIPVAMPAVLSVTMALGALALSKKKAIVSKLQAIEEMAGIDILCSDKTGTLTKNLLTLGEPVTVDDVDAQHCVLAAALASKRENEDAIDNAVIGGLKDPTALLVYTQENFVPFDPVSKRTESTSVDGQGVRKRYTKGAPQVIMEMAGLDEAAEQKAARSVDEMARRGYRALGVAESADDGATWRFLGLLPLFDPPRDDSKETIEQAKAHGLAVKMVTGDDVAIGSEISGQLGLGTNLHAAADFFPPDADVSRLPNEIEEAVERADGFARVFPEHKYGIVKALQDRDHLVAMTGDGVNDAPALKQADCGIAVSGATDAARAAADLILTEPGLSVIIQAIEEARKIFERMMSYTIYRIAMTIDIMFFVVLATIFFEFRPLTAIMIIVLALLDDIPIMTIAYDNTRINESPVRWQMNRVLVISSILGLLSVAETFGLLLIGKEWMTLPHFQAWIHIDQDMLRSMMFLQLVAGGHLLLFLTRTQKFFLSPPFPSLVLTIAIIGTQIFAVLMCGFGWLVPVIPWPMIGLVWIYNIIWMFVIEFVKLCLYRRFDQQDRHLEQLGQSLQTRG
ncbi:Magnesium-transporting ATPase, P-type 1 [Planctomycetes bacterium Pan216]|uniref:Magnesium-transporting ATPase, P-type 1 n=1 Tax=Kolteria novifilia TaxID=2527975 RepID=A0A518BC01_9BACT|nr:Magnesium-transporting ATPase, P-type 1 [Planctomycetes bacterium Pan216]